VLERNSSIITLLFISGLSSQLVLADVYKCVSSTGKVSYSEKRCQEGRIKKNGRWENVKEHEAELHQNILNKIELAETKGMSDADVTLLNSVLKADYENLSELNYSYEQWLQIWELLKLRDASLDAVASEISLRYKAGEVNIYEAQQFNLFKAKKFDEWFNKRISEMKKIGTYVVTVMEEHAKEAARVKEEARAKEEEALETYNKSLTVKPKIPVEQAIQACRNYARARTFYNDTFDFSIFIDLYTKKRYDGGWLVESTFTVKNAFNLEVKHKISCAVSESGAVTEGVIY